ncbi:hypothetical protein BLNAU_6004 [Blattamonas nauphoetae]|uniref:Protein kinase domain-containing protein n=1 Tax=Blattamonas nauphoetae TaxID=2049346 RepID=A0ABQ9Y5K8_9EUKA|nr:hypothetical protein BLNAU_6004 [Blattamonas nauphoetae]
MYPVVIISLLSVICKTWPVELPDLFTENQNEVLLPNSDFQCHGRLLESGSFAIRGQNGTVIRLLDRQLQIDDKTKSTERVNNAPQFLFKIANSTASFSVLQMSLGSLNAEQPNRGESVFGSKPTSTRSKYCAVIDASIVTFSDVLFNLEMPTAPLLITSSQMELGYSSSVGLVGCWMKTGTDFIGSFTEIRSDEDSATTASVTVALSSFVSMSLLGRDGIAATTSAKSAPPLLTTTITSSHFANMTSTSVGCGASDVRRVQILSGNDLWRVDDAVYGTVASLLGSSQRFDLINSTLMECENPRTTRNEDDATIKNVTGTHTFTSAAGTFRNETGFTHYHFTNCIITSTVQSASFYIIHIGNLAGAIKLTNCSITSDCQNFHVYLIALTGVDEGSQTLSIDSCTVKYDKVSTLPATNYQISTRYVLTTFSHSTFESPNGASRTRAFSVSSAVSFVQISNCHFSDQTTSTTSPVISHPNTAPIVLLVSDSLFENNEAGTDGGSFATYTGYQSFFRCIFQNNEAGKRGGALYMNSIQHVYLEDTHFDNNKALGNLGQDIFVEAQNCSFFYASNVIGCTSTATSNKIDFSKTPGKTEDLSLLDVLFSEPKTITIPHLFVKEGGSGESCLEATPCHLISAAFSKAESVFTQIHVAVGDHSLSDETIAQSIQIVGQGWMANSTKFTNLTMGGISLGNNGNLTLSSLTLHPLSTSSVILSHSASDASSLLTNVRLENIQKHSTTLFSFSQGSAVFRVCTFNTITLTTSAAISITGSASLSLFQVWFMHIDTTGTTGGSCLDAETSGYVSIEKSDVSYCSSEGPAGAFFFKRVDDSTLTLSSLIFTENKASSTLSSIGHDMVLTGFDSSFLSVSSPVSSFSDKPRALVGGRVVDFQIPSCGFYQFGIRHPINSRFYTGVPLSKFKGLSFTVNNLVTPGYRADIKVVNTDPILIEDLSFFNLTVNLFWMTLVHDHTSSTAHHLISTESKLDYRTGSITLPADPLTSPFIVDGANALLAMYFLPISLPSVLSHPFIVNRAGSVSFALVSLATPAFMRGCSFIESISGTVSLSQRTLANIHSDVDGSFLNAKNTTVQFVGAGFVNCSARNGGALFVELNGAHYVQAVFGYNTPVSFRDCRATATDENGVLVGKGGAIYVKGTSTNSRPIRFNTTALNHARFENNTAAWGKDVFIESSLFEGKSVDEIPVFGGGSLSSMYRVVIEGRTDEREMEEIHHFIPAPSISVNGSVIEPSTGASGTDDENCKWVGTHCATLAFGVTHLKQKYQNGTHFPLQIHFVWNMTYTEKAVHVTNQDITVIGTKARYPTTAEMLRSTLDVDQSADEGSFVFTIDDTALLTMTNLNIRAIAQCGLFDVKDDAECLTLNDVAVICTDAEGYRHPLIKSTHSPVFIRNCIFNTTETSLGPAVVGVSLISFSSTEHALSVESSRFKSFSVSGPALLAITTEQPISFVSVVFEDVTQTVAEKARFVHVTSSSLGTAVSPSRWSSFSPTQPLLDFVGCDSSLASDHPFFESSLLFHLLPPTDKIVVGETDTSEESAHPRCGSDRLRCSTLNSALSSAVSHSLQTSIRIATRVSLSSPLAISTTASFSSLSGKQEVAIDRTGSMSVSKDCDLTLACLSFSLEAGERYFSVLFVSEGFLTLDSCSFGSDSATNLDSPLLTITGSLTVKSTEFTKIKTVNEKGLVWIELSDSDEASFASSTFSDCSSSTAPLLSLTLPTTQPTNWDFDLSGLSFTSASSNEIPEGALIFISGSSFATLIGPSRFPEVDSETDMNKFWGVDSSTCVESSLLVYLVEIGSVIEVDGQNGRDIVHCGHFGVACETMGKAIERGKVEESSKLLRILNETTMKERISPNSVTLSILGDSISQPICVSREGQFEIADGKLVLDSLSFSTTVASFTRSLMTLHTSGSLSIASCSFSSFSSTTSASILTATVRQSESITISESSFISCESSDSSRSGVLDVTLAEGSTFTLSHSSSPFTSCSSPKATATLIFIAHPSLSASVITSSLCFGWDQTAESLTDFVGMEGVHSVPVPLFLYFSSFETEVFISNDSCDASICGFSEYPCASLSALHAKIEDMADKIVTFRTSIDHSTELALSKDITLSGSKNQMTIKETAVKETPKGLFAISAKVSIEQLFIQVPSTFKHASLLHCQTGSLEVSNCTLREVGSSAIPSTLIVVERGASLVVSETFFESICSSNENAGIISAILTEAAQLHLTNNTFTSCFCSGQANSVLLELANTTTVESDSFDYSMTDLVFESLPSDSATPPSIDVLVIGHNLARTITRVKWEGSFTRTKESSLWGTDRATQLNMSLLPYLVSLEESVEIDDDGTEFEKCGHFEIFCKSVELGMSRMKEACLSRMTVMSRITATAAVEPKGDLSVEGHSASSLLSFSSNGRFLNTPQDGSDFSLSFSSITIVVPTHSFQQSLFSSASEKLSFTSCSIVGTTSDPVTFSLIELTSGELVITSTDVKTITLHSSPLIKSSGSTTMLESNFSSIERVDGLGCVLEADTSCLICVKNCLFTSCTSNNTHNWILLLGANTGTLLQENWEGTLSSDSLRSSVLLSSSSASSLSDEISVFDTHSLLYEFYPRVAPRIVVTRDWKNEDHPLCGSAELPCLSVDVSVGLTGVREVEVRGEAEIGRRLKMDGDFLTIEGHKKRGVVKMVGKGQIVNNEFDDPDTLLLSFITVDVSLSTLEEGGIVVNENGETRFESASISSSSTIKPSLVQLTGGQAVILNLTLTDLTFSSTVLDLSSFDSASLTDLSTLNCSVITFVKASNGSHFSVKSSTFIGTSSVTVVNAETEEEMNTNICDWTGAFLDLTNTTTILDRVGFSHLQSGAVRMDGGSLRVLGGIFSDNSASNTSFPSVRRNIHCSRGQLNVESLGGGDGSKDFPSAWITAGEDCQFSSSIVDTQSPLFIPTLLPSKSSVTTDSKTKFITADISGTLLIPCDLSLEVFEWNDTSHSETGKTAEISANVQKWNETAVVVVLNESSLSQSLSAIHEWRLRLIFGVGVRGSESLTVKVSRAAERKAQAAKAMKVLLPIVIAVFVALVLFFVVVCVLCRRRKGKKSEEKENLLSRQELDVVEMKVDVDGSLNMMIDQQSNNFPSDTLHNSKAGIAGFTGEVGKEGTKKVEENEKEEIPTVQFLCEAMRCDGQFETCIVDIRQSLFNRIHKPTPNAAALPRFQIAYEIVEGLKRMEKDAALQRFMFMLNPHRILLGAEDQVFLKVEETAAVPPDKHPLHPPDASDPHPTPHRRIDGVSSYENGNLQRWVAPELSEMEKSGEEKAAMTKEDLRAASVFSLGLVLFEMETGMVPFGEIDGISAQRQLGTGTRPNMTNVGSEMKELISECLDVDKTGRPTLSRIQERLVEIGKKTEQLTSEEAQSVLGHLKGQVEPTPR